MSFDRDSLQGQPEQVVDWNRWRFQGGRMSAAWADQIGLDIMLREARVVVDIVIGRGKRVTVMGGLAKGERHNGVQLNPVYVTSARDSRRVTVWPALMSEPELRDSITLDAEGGVSAGARSLSVTVDGRLVDPKQIIRAGWPLYGTAEVSLLAPGLDWEQRSVFLRGTITGTTHGDSRELVTFTIADPVYTSPEVPPWVLDTSRFERCPDVSVGERIPIVVNGGHRSPGQRVDTVVGSSYNNDFVVAHGHAVGVTAVYVNNTLIGSTYYSEVQSYDLLGQPVSLVRFAPTAGTSYWSSETAQLYAELEDDTAASRGLIQTARYLTNQYGLGPREQLSERLFSESIGKLGQVGYSPVERASPKLTINAPTTLYEYLGTALFEEYPMVTLAWEDDGMGPIVVDQRAEPTAKLKVGVYPVLDRAEGAEYQWVGAQELRNRYTLRYNYDPQVNVYSSVSVRSTDNNTMCAWSFQTQGEQPAAEREALTVRDSRTAAFILDWLVDHGARPTCDVVVAMFPEAWFQLRRGDTVEWSDPSVGFSAVKGVILGRSWNEGRVEFQIRIFPDLLTKAGGGSRAFDPAPPT